MKRLGLISGILLLLLFMAAPALPQGGFGNTTGYVITTCGSPPAAFVAGNPGPFTVNTAGQMCGDVSVSASITGFPTVQTTGTPISVTTGGVTGTLPSGTVVVASNVGTTNTAYCKLGASASTSDQPIAPNGGWFSFTVGANTQLTCITSTSTTTVNMVGGSGLPTGTGGGGGGSGGGGAVTIADGADVTQGALADTACATDNGSCSVTALIKRNNQRSTTINTTLGTPFQAGGSIGNTTFAVTNAGTFATQLTGATNNLNNISGTISLPTGAATATNQTNVTGTKNAGTAATNSLLGGLVYNATPLTPSDGQGLSLQGDANGYLKVNVAAATGVANPSTTSGQTMSLVGAASTTSPLACTTANSCALNLTPLGGLRTDLASLAGTALGAPANYGTSPGAVAALGVNAFVTNTVAITANSSVNVAQINGVTPLMGNGATGTGSPRVTLSSDGTAISTAGYMSVKLDQTTPGTTNAVSLAQIGGTTIVNGGVAGSQSVGGTVATNVAITANPLNLGAQAVSSENAAVTTARQVQLVADLVGKLIVLPYANPENFVSGTITSAMTGTTSTSLVAAPAAGLRNYITQCTVSNSHATVGTDMILQDGSGGTTLYVIPASPAFGGASITFPTPLRQPTTATALFIANVTTGSNTKASCSGYKGA